MSLEERSNSCGGITGSKGVVFAKRIQLIFDKMSRSPCSPAGGGNARLSWFVNRSRASKKKKRSIRNNGGSSGNNSGGYCNRFVY